MAAASGVAEKQTAPAAPPAIPPAVRKPVVTEADVQPGEFSFRTFSVSLPEGVEIDALADPASWRHVQDGARPFQVLDHVFVSNFELTWWAFCVVAAATPTGASLAVVSKKDLPQRTQALPETDRYRIKFAGRAFI